MRFVSHWGGQSAFRDRGLGEAREWRQRRRFRRVQCFAWRLILVCRSGSASQINVRAEPATARRGNGEVSGRSRECVNSSRPFIRLHRSLWRRAGSVLTFRFSLRRFQIRPSFHNRGLRGRCRGKVLWGWYGGLAGGCDGARPVFRSVARGVLGCRLL